MQGMLTRFITDRVREVLSFMPAVALLGARQVGKTTLAQAVTKERPSIYLDLEKSEDLALLANAGRYLRDNGDKLIVLDEIQRSPDLFLTLRGVIDDNRAAGRKAGQFLILGSASMDLLRQSSESLAGRIGYVDMGGLNILETGQENARRLWLRGGFPECYTAATDDEAAQQADFLVRTYLERDIPQFGFDVPAERVRRLWTMLAHLQGQNVNFNQLAANLEVDRKTVVHNAEILVGLKLLRSLPPWHANIRKRLVKSPRHYVRDSGILHTLLGINEYESLLSNPILGKSWEGFVIENLLSVLPPLAEAYHFRTQDGAEVDLVLKLPGQQVWAVEIKHGDAPKIGKHFERTCKDIGATRNYIVYGGDREFPVGDVTRVISLEGMMEKLAGMRR